MSAPGTAARDLAGQFITFMETGTPPEGLFTPDVFCDFTLPQWRLQARGIEDVTALRKAGHPGPSRVPRSRFDPTTTGFVLEFEERWDQDGESWYSREMIKVERTRDSVLPEFAGDLLPREGRGGAIVKLSGRKIFPDVSLL